MYHRNTAERAKLGTTHLTPRWALNDSTTTITVFARSLERILCEVEARADADGLIPLWHTLKITGELMPTFQAFGFRVSVQGVKAEGRTRAQVLEEAFAAARRLEARRKDADPITASVEETQ